MAAGRRQDGAPGVTAVLAFDDGSTHGGGGGGGNDNGGEGGFHLTPDREDSVRGRAAML